MNKVIDKGEIKYTTDQTLPNEKSPVYKSPVPVTENTILKAKLFYSEYSGQVLSKNINMHNATALSYTLKDTWKQYDGAGKYGLTDGISGILNRYNTWVGFSGKDLDAVVDLQKVHSIKSLSVNFYNKNRAWIFLPSLVEYSVSTDGVNYQTVYKNEQVSDTLQNSIVHLEAKINNTNVRYVRVFAKNIGHCPVGHEGEGQDAWLFADEIVVE